MKQRIHPDYHPVVFRDRAANVAFLTRSIAASERTITWEDGSTYPVVDVEISSASHPFYTGQARSRHGLPGGSSSAAGMATTPRAPDDSGTLCAPRARAVRL